MSDLAIDDPDRLARRLRRRLDAEAERLGFSALGVADLAALPDLVADLDGFLAAQRVALHAPRTAKPGPERLSEIPLLPLARPRRDWERPAQQRIVAGLGGVFRRHQPCHFSMAGSNQQRTQTPP